MRLLSIEPTPNPNSMKLNLDEALPPGVSHTYRLEGKAHYSGLVQKLISIPGVESLYHCLDFMAIQRRPSSDWESLLSESRRILSDNEPLATLTTKEEEPWGEVHVSVQNFRRIPMLVKVSSGREEVRVPLPERFGEAVARATPSSPNMLLERKWIPQEPRFGERKEVGEMVASEIDAAFDQARLDELVKRAFVVHPEKGGPEEAEASRVLTDEARGNMLASDDWRQRYAALESMGAAPEHFTALLGLMGDSNVSVRRLATVYMGLLKTPESFSPLLEAMKDPTVAVRRSAGDALNDRGDPAAAPAMIVALKDGNKLVRWRASRFLYELGDTGALPALREAAEDPEFEVRMQIRQAIERIEGGHRAQGPVWMQMTKP